MHLINRSLQLLLVTCFAVPVSAYADSWSCSHGRDVREVFIERTTSETVPCNVVYKKRTEGVEDQILWNAVNDDTYCEDKAKGFVAKLESLGWVCTETVTDIVTEAPEDTSDEGTADTSSKKSADTSREVPADNTSEEPAE